MNSLEPSRNSEKLKVLLEKLEDRDHSILQEFINEIIEEVDKPSIENIWLEDKGAISYWIVVINGINNPEEAELANDLLFWKEFFAKDTAKVRCIQSSEISHFNFCMNHFNVGTCPVIIFSDDPYFRSSIRIDQQLISQIRSGNNGLQNFFTRVHSMMIRKSSLEEINKSLINQQFWNYFKIAYSEIKSFVSISVKADIK